MAHDPQRLKIEQRIWPKLNLTCHCKSQLIVSVIVQNRCGPDQPMLIPLVRASEKLIHFDRILADAGYDSEKNHKVCREILGIRSTIIPAVEHPHLTILNKSRRKYKTCSPKDDPWFNRHPERVKKNFWKIFDRKRYRYRTQMREHFPKRIYHRRAQVESVISRLKRVLGSNLRCRTSKSQRSECYVRILTYNLLLLAPKVRSPP